MHAVLRARRTRSSPAPHESVSPSSLETTHLALSPEDRPLSLPEQVAVLCPERHAEVEELLAPERRQDLGAELVLPAVEERQVARAVVFARKCTVQVERRRESVRTLVVRETGICRHARLEALGADDILRERLCSSARRRVPRAVTAWTAKKCAVRAKRTRAGQRQARGARERHRTRARAGDLPVQELDLSGRARQMKRVIRGDPWQNGGRPRGCA